MTRDDLAKLRAIAEAATQPSPWTVREDHRGADERRCMVVDRDDMWVADCGNDDENSHFIAAANPAAVLSLLDELARVRRLAEEACELTEKAPGALSSLYRSEFYRRDGARIAAIREEIGK